MTERTLFDRAGELVVAGMLAAITAVSIVHGVELFQAVMGGSLDSGDGRSLGTIATIAAVLTPVFIGGITLTKLGAMLARTGYARHKAMSIAIAAIYSGGVVYWLGNPSLEGWDYAKFGVVAVVGGLIIVGSATLIRSLRADSIAWTSRRRASMLAVVVILIAAPVTAAAALHEPIPEDDESSDIFVEPAQGFAAYDDGQIGPSVATLNGSLKDGYSRAGPVTLQAPVENRNVSSYWYSPSYNVSRTVEMEPGSVPVTKVAVENHNSRVTNARFLVDLPDSWESNTLNYWRYHTTDSENANSTYFYEPAPDWEVLVMENVDEVHIAYDVVNENGEIVRYLIHFDRTQVET